MREIAQRADSEITGSSHVASSFSRVTHLARAVAPREKSELPRAMHALRTRPCHLARLIGLPLKNKRNSAALKDASHSRRGKKRDSVLAELAYPVLILSTLERENERG